MAHLLAHKLFQVLLPNPNSSVWLIVWILTDITTMGQSEPGSNGNEGVLHIPQSSMNRTSPSDAFVSYPGHFLGVGWMVVLPLCRDAVGVFYGPPVDWVETLNEGLELN